MSRVHLLFLAGCTLSLAGCDLFNYDPTGYRDCREFGGTGWTWVVDDPENCGWCNARCPEGVPCADYECQLSSVMHCGEADRQCVAVEGEGVDCVYFGEADIDLGVPEGVELVNGYGCVPVALTGDAGVGGGDAGVPADAGMQGVPKRLDPRWVMIPGYTPECEDGFDRNGCVTGEVALTDLCGAPLVEPLAYDFSIMTEEMSRGQYRELMCDCAAPRFTRCRALCAERDAPDAAERDALPMTGLNWCEAYTACQALDARLPTVRERARLEAAVGAPAALLDDPLSCAAWAEATGGVPWLMECLEAAPGAPGFDAVKGDAGRLFIGEGVLSRPEPVRHLLGNVAEWAADPAAALVARASSAEPSFWGPPRDEAEARQPRLLSGRSLFSPAGERGDRLVAVDPSLRSEDIGLRCARTLRTPYGEPVPYDAELLAEDHARCDHEQSALRPVRRTIGEQVYRAINVCFDRTAPRAARAKFEYLGRDLLVDPSGRTAFARRASAGILESVGIARFAGDEQWWLGEPADAAGQMLRFMPESGIERWMPWQGESRPELSRCGADAVPSLIDGKIVRRHTFILPSAHRFTLGVDGAEFACTHLDCVDPTIGQAACASDCPGWLLPYAIEFERVEAYPSRDLCR